MVLDKIALARDDTKKLELKILESKYDLLNGSSLHGSLSQDCY
ncbi:hypothetical protein [Helicobacter macacae]|nr:hypothetical protein [Helicobacter macacae]